MAITPHVFGPAVILAGPTGSATTQVGYTTEGFRFDQKFLKQDVMSDRFGGLCPIDQQDMLSYIDFDFELVEWDATALNLITTCVYGGTPGSVGTPGRFMIRGSLSWRFTIVSIYSEPTINFVNCWPTSVVAGPYGTTYSRVAMTWHALPNASGVIFNNVSS